MAEPEVATLGGGCFWCLEAAYELIQGVQEVESGYSGGQVDHPTYEQVCTGTTGHAEVVQVRFDGGAIPFREMLEVFFAIHDPTTKDRQGNDVGPQYRSAIFYHSEAQQQTAQAVMAELARDGVFRDPIATELLPLERFWPAEDYHRQYFRRHPAQPYCIMVVGPKVAKLRQKFRHRLK